MLEGKDLWFTYKDGPSALRGVSFALPRGRVVGLLGDNGAGKTTLIRCVCGLYKPRGSVTLDGKGGEGIKGNLAYITGEGAAVGSMTPRETGEFLAEYYPRFDGKRYQKLLEYFALPNAPVKRLSKGERAKAELAVGFSRGADYILMDEPFSGKDVFTRKEFLKIMAGMLRENETLLVSTHLIEEVESFIDHVLILHEGKLVADTGLDELREGGKTLLSFLAEKTGYQEGRAAGIFGEEEGGQGSPEGA